MFDGGILINVLGRLQVISVISMIDITLVINK